MIDFELFAKIKNYHEQKGLSAAQISRELALDPRTVAKWLAEKRLRQRESSRRSSMLDSFKASIARMLEAHPYTAVQILQRIREEGYGGGYTIVKDYVRRVRPKRAPAFLKLSFAPGECAQVDWGSYGSIEVGETRRRLSFFVMVLCYSRRMYVEFTVSQTMEHFLACHQNAFAAFNGVPAKVMVDNLKSAVLKRALGQDPVLNPVYLDFADHFGFAIAPCGVSQRQREGTRGECRGVCKEKLPLRPRSPVVRGDKPRRGVLARHRRQRAHTRGDPEKTPRYVRRRKNPLFFPFRPSLRCRYNLAGEGFLAVSSHPRDHRYSVPAEYAGGRPSPSKPIPTGSASIAATSSSPATQGATTEIKTSKTRIIPGVDRTTKESPRPENLHALSHPFSEAQNYYRELEKRRMNPRHHVQKIVALAEIYGAEPVARAMEDAFSFQAFSCEYIANILEQRSRALPEPGALHLTRRSDLLDLDVQQPDLSVYQKDIRPV